MASGSEVGVSRRRKHLLVNAVALRGASDALSAAAAATTAVLLLLCGVCPTANATITTVSTTANYFDESSCMQSLGGYVGGGNYTYYRLAQEGEVTLLLRSVSGDADIYVSQSTLQPTWQTEDNDLQSVTCGEDRIDIPGHFRRPMGIGIYGHPSHDVSVYRLCVNMDWNSVDENAERERGAGDYDYNSYDDSEGADGNAYEERASAHNAQVPFRGGGYDKETDGEESLLWTVVIGILKIIVEVFM